MIKKDFAALNKIALKKGSVMSDQKDSFTKEAHSEKFDSVSNSRKTEISKDVIFGKPTRLSTPMADVINFHFNHVGEQIMKEKYLQVQSTVSYHFRNSNSKSTKRSFSKRRQTKRRLITKRPSA